MHAALPRPWPVFIALSLVLLAASQLASPSTVAVAEGPRERLQAAKPRPNLTSVELTKAIGPKHFAFVRVQANCPEGTVVISGGAKITNVYPGIVESYPGPDFTWVTTAVQPNFYSFSPAPQGADVTSFAICAPAGKAVVAGTDTNAAANTIVVAEKSIAIPAIWAAQVQIFSPCPDGYGVISGGADIDDSSYPYLTQSEPIFLNGGGWEATAIQPMLGNGVTHPDAGRLKVYALCGKKGQSVVGPAAQSKPSTLKWDDKVVPIDNKFYAIGKTRVRCGKGYRVIGGGVLIEGSSFAHIAQSFPEFGQNAWTGAVVQPRFAAATIPAGQMTVTAICAKKGTPIVPFS